MATPQKKPRLSPTRTTLTTLPPVLQRHVLAYVANENCLERNMFEGFTVNANELRPLALVSKAWYALATEALSERLLQVLYVRNEHVTRRSEMLALRNQFVLRRAHTRRVAVEFSLYATASAQVFPEVLSHAPNLHSLDIVTPRDLDLEGAPTDIVVNLVLAATRHCRSLKKLTTPHALGPPKSGKIPRYDSYKTALENAVYTGLKVWSAHAGGLRELVVPRETICVDSEAYMAHIVAFCPRIRSYSVYTTRKLNVDAWDRFCQVCTDLEKLTWESLPFATHLYGTFGNYAKPKLRSLTLRPSPKWSSDDLCAVANAKTQMIFKTTSFGEAATCPESILRATPNLEKLIVNWYGYYHRGEAIPPKEIPAFRDEFIEALARFCPRLRKLYHLDAPFTNAITDRSMRVLGMMPCLKRLRVSTANITGRGLFELVTTAAGGLRRDFDISLGEKVPDVASMIFYDVLEGFLERLAAHESALPCQSRPVSLRLQNQNGTHLEPDQSAEWLVKLRHLAQQVRARHPSLQLRGIAHDYDSESGTMARMSEFRYYTGSDTPPEPEPWEMNEPIDDVFVRRVYPKLPTPPPI